MQRREFCKLMAAATAASAIHASGQSDATADAGMPAGFNSLERSYADFCSTPAEQRVFYALVDGKIVEQKLEEASWKATAWGAPPELPIPGGSWDGVPMNPPVSGLNGSGPYQPTWDSLLNYDAPEWYQDAKFGIWAHWSPQCVPEDGDWYARNMYIQNQQMRGNHESQYEFHLKHYGPQSRFGYKDLCAQWTLLNWEPDALIERYKNAGARIFISLANHHDGFDAWDSKHQPWNSAAHGPHRDVVGTWAAAARKQGLRFGVTVHQARNWWWFQPSHGADATGPQAGVPYDGRLTAAEGKEQWWQGLDPQRLYSVKHPFDALPDPSYAKNFYDRTRDLIDQHDPDLLYFDNALFPLGWAGMCIGAYFYNHNLQTRSGRQEGVINIKNVPDKYAKSVIADYERGITSGIMKYPWQSETCIGQWHYQRGLYDHPGEYGGYLPPSDVIHWLVDTVSKNGTFILNVPGKPDGTIDGKEMAVVDQIAAWMKINGEAIYETRPWKIYGEGPSKPQEAGAFKGRQSISGLSAKDIRFTRNKANNVIYAIFLGWPEGEARIASLGSSAQTNPGKIEHVALVGSDAKVKFRQTPEALRVTLPAQTSPAGAYGAAIKISLG
jgi:alpha-L-fucosidase